MEEKKDNQARATLQQPRQPPKVLISHMRKPPVGWPSGMKTRATPIPIVC